MFHLRIHVRQNFSDDNITESKSWTPDRADTICYLSPLSGHEYPKISSNQFLPDLAMLFLP